MKKFILLTLACAACFVSCKSNALENQNGDFYCFICSENETPVQGYCFYVGDKCVAVTNQNGFAAIPRSALKKQTVDAKKPGWESFTLDENVFSSRQVLCMVALSFEQLCKKVSDCLEVQNLSEAEETVIMLKQIAVTESQKDTALLLESLTEYQRGHYQSAYDILQNVKSEEPFVLKFGLCLLREVQNEK